MNPIIETMFRSRDYGDDWLRSIESVSDEPLLDVDRAVALLCDVSALEGRVLVVTDFDADGIMSGVVCIAGLRALGISCDLAMPEPENGYGFGADYIARQLESHPETSLLLTCDVGCTCFDGIERAKAANLPVIVTDHHHEAVKGHVAADAIVNPCRFDEHRSFNGICGATVIWKVLHELALAVGGKRELALIDALSVFTGIGTIGDVMPVYHENRGIIRHAIAICRQLWCFCEMDRERIEGGFAPSSLDDFLSGFSAVSGDAESALSAFYGLSAFLFELARRDKATFVENVTEELIGFYMTPALNAPKRLAMSLELPFSIFLSPGDFASKLELVRKLFEVNDERKGLVADAMARLDEMDQPFSPILWLSDAKGGVLGLLASQLLKRYRSAHPVFVVSEKEDNGAFGGSGRSPQWFPALTILREGGFSPAGHEGAFGITLKDRAEASRLIDFCEKAMADIFEKAAADSRFVRDFDYSISESEVVSGDFGLDVPLFWDYLEEERSLRPFGQGFAKPEGRLFFDGADAEWRVMGKDKTHLKAVLPRGFSVLLWNQAEFLDAVREKEGIRVDGALAHNHFRGVDSVVFQGNLVL